MAIDTGGNSKRNDDYRINALEVQIASTTDHVKDIDHRLDRELERSFRLTRYMIVLCVVSVFAAIAALAALYKATERSVPPERAAAITRLEQRLATLESSLDKSPPERAAAIARLDHLEQQVDRLSGELNNSQAQYSRLIDKFNKLAQIEIQQDIVLLSDDEYLNALQKCVDTFYDERRTKYFSNGDDRLANIKVTRERELLFALRTDTSSVYGALLSRNKVERLEIYILISRNPRRDQVNADFYPGDLRAQDFERLDLPRPAEYRFFRDAETGEFEHFLHELSDEVSLCVRRAPRTNAG